MHWRQAFEIVEQEEQELRDLLNSILEVVANVGRMNALLQVDDDDITLLKNLNHTAPAEWLHYLRQKAHDANSFGAKDIEDAESTWRAFTAFAEFHIEKVDKEFGLISSIETLSFAEGSLNTLSFEMEEPVSAYDIKIGDEVAYEDDQGHLGSGIVLNYSDDEFVIDNHRGDTIVVYKTRVRRSYAH